MWIHLHSLLERLCSPDSWIQPVLFCSCTSPASGTKTHSVINAQQELSSGSQNWVETRLHHQESQFSKIFSFLYNVASFLDPLTNQPLFKHKHTQSSLLFCSLVFPQWFHLFFSEMNPSYGPPVLIFSTFHGLSQASLPFWSPFSFNKHLGLRRLLRFLHWSSISWNETCVLSPSLFPGHPLLYLMLNRLPINLPH